MTKFYSLPDFLLYAEEDLEKNETFYASSEAVNEANPPDWIMQNICSYLRSLKRIKYKNTLFDLSLN